MSEERLARLAELEARRRTFDDLWEEVRRLVLPVAESFTVVEWPGQRIRQGQLDSSGEHAAEMLASGLHGLVADPGSVFFRLRHPDRSKERDHDANVWLERATTVLLDIFAAPRSQFLTSTHEAILEIVVFGAGTVICYDRPGDLPLFESVPLSETYLDVGAAGMTDTVYRRRRMTARQAHLQWGDKAGPTVTKAMAAKAPGTLVDILHAIEPRADRERRRRGRSNRDMPYRSTWVSITDKHTIEESGFREFPAPTGRWVRRPGEVYGRGPGLKTLADVKLAQRAKASWIQSAELTGLPPLLIADDGVMGDILWQPLALNYTRRDLLGQQRAIEPLMTGARPDVNEAMLAMLRQSVEENFYVPLMRSLREKRGTATEAMLVVQEARQLLWPFVGRIMTELLDRLIHRALAVAIRRRYVPEPPPELAGDAARIEYLTPIALTRRSAEVQGLQQWMALTEPHRAAGVPVDDMLDADRALRDAAVTLGMPHRWLRSERDLRELRAQRQQQAEAQQQAEQALQTADAAAKVGKALPDIQEGLAGMLPAGRA